MKTGQGNLTGGEDEEQVVEKGNIQAGRDYLAIRGGDWAGRKNKGELERTNQIVHEDAREGESSSDRPTEWPHKECPSKRGSRNSEGVIVSVGGKRSDRSIQSEEAVNSAERKGLGTQAPTEKPGGLQLAKVVD